MSVYRIKYVKSSVNTVEIEASSVSEAAKKIKANQIEEAVWSNEGQFSYKVEVSEEITKHMAANPKS